MRLVKYETKSIHLLADCLLILTYVEEVFFVDLERLDLNQFFFTIATVQDYISYALIYCKNVTQM